MHTWTEPDEQITSNLRAQGAPNFEYLPDGQIPGNTINLPRVITLSPEPAPNPRYEGSNVRNFVLSERERGRAQLDHWRNREDGWSADVARWDVEDARQDALQASWRAEDANRRADEARLRAMGILGARLESQRFINSPGRGGLTIRIQRRRDSIAFAHHRRYRWEQGRYLQSTIMRTTNGRRERFGIKSSRDSSQEFRAVGVTGTRVTEGEWRK
ncbi:hypothetical protein FPQ18DRAFT_301532 [Pyronema domesticum]|nr:hypothetical protein FPQ18DRAFT_301532 [Pyronema domesticum]